MKVEEVGKLLQGTFLNETNRSKEIGAIAIDSRTMRKNDVFLCLLGKTLDGHNFIEDALLKMPSLIIVSKKVSIKTKVPILLVEDTLEAYFRLARYHLDQIGPSVVAVTGSVGKTTTKELIWKFLRIKYRVCKSEGNHNNHIGVPMTMLKLKPRDEILLLEMGMNHQGEIERLSKLATPQISVITNIGTSHIGYLKSKRNIFRAKMEITKGMHHGMLVLNGEDHYLKRVKENDNYDVVMVDHHLFPHIVKEHENVLEIIFRYQKQVYRFFLPRYYAHLKETIWIALEVGVLYHVPMRDMVHVLNHLSLTLPGRLEKIPFGNHQYLIDDTYNASYESTKVALQYLQSFPGEKCLIFGDILELGKQSKKIHHRVARLFSKAKGIHYVFIGTEVKVMKKQLKEALYFETVEQYIKYLETHPATEKMVLLKASHNVHLSKLIPIFREM